MSNPTSHTFLGFGLGAIQAGLFLHEAARSGAFGRLVVAEVQSDSVVALRRAGGRLGLNIARADRIETESLGPIEVENPSDPLARERLVGAVADAHEIATAVPSVHFYTSPGPGSIHRILAEGLARRARAGGAPCVIYTAENHNHAAEILEQAVMAEIPPGDRWAARSRAKFLNTVIGKMSGVITDPAEIAARGLVPFAEGISRAFLVEEFNRILISEIRFHAGDHPGFGSFQRGIAVFEEKPDLLPFEEAKLYGHNAIHAAAAYLARRLGLARMDQLRGHGDVLAFLRAAFVEETGAALRRKHKTVDPFFSIEEYVPYVDDLLTRMTNPHLGDLVERVGRDVRRKLGWNDRLIGALRLTIAQGASGLRLATATAAALIECDPAVAEPARPVASLLKDIWGPTGDLGEEASVVAAIERGRAALQRWETSGRRDIEAACRG